MRLQAAARQHRALLIFLIGYAIVLLLFLDKKPLFLDEILDLVGVRGATLSGVLNFVPTNAGGVPLGYLCDLAMIQLLGYSVFAVRLPSVIFSLIACVGVYKLAQEARLSRPLWAVICYALSPVQFRYAMVARPYSQAACWSVLSTVVFFKLIDTRLMRWSVVYFLLVAAGLYAQPYTIFVPIAHFFWLASTSFKKWTRSLQPKQRALVFVGGAIASAGLAFLPWFFKASAAWQKIIGFGPSPYSSNSIKGTFLVAHELTGAGYAGFGLALICVFVALHFFPFLKTGQKLFWILYLVVPLLCVLAANAIFGYFLAIRQFIFILIPLAVLIAMAAEALMNTERLQWGLLAPACLVVAMLYGNIRLLGQPGEGWQAAAAALSKQTSVPGACALFVPPDARDSFVFFEPGLAGTVCDPENLSASDTVVVAIRSLGPTRFYSEANEKLDRAGFSKERDLRSEEPRLEIYRRSIVPRP